MKQQIYLLLTMLTLCTSCSQKIYKNNSVSNPVTEEGTIRISSNGKGNNLPNAYDNAVENAFEKLLFKGIPESVQTTPLIPNEETARQQHQNTLNCFKEKTCYSQFITSSSQDGKKQQVRDKGLITYQVTSDVTINLRALRTYLEQKNVIRKFGF